MPINQPPTVFVIDDDIVVCNSLRWLFGSVNLNTEIYHSGCDYLKIHNPNRPGCLLIDVRLPDMNGLEIQQQLLKQDNPIPIIVITGYGDISLAVRAMRAGAKDFIQKPYNDEVLLEQIQKAIIENKEYHFYQKNILERLARLTLRENEIMQFIIEGKLNKQIAKKLDISVSTVEKHRSSIMQKTHSKSTAELIAVYLLSIKKNKTS